MMKMLFGMVRCLRRMIIGLLTGSKARMAFGNNGAMRRALVGILFVFSFIFSYLYWNEISSTIQPAAMQEPHRRKALALKEGPGSVKSSPWTWVCLNNHCIRQSKVTNGTQLSNGHSLRTCNMLCGSTQLWPQPTGPVSLGSISVSFFPNQFQLDLQAPAQVIDMAHQAFDIFKTNVAAMVKNYEEGAEIQYQPDVLEFIVKMTIENPDTEPTLNVKEGYSCNLHLNNDNIVATIHADTYFGARHALETLSQLIWWDDELENLRILKIAAVQDQPMFKYRGIMLDTARNFFSVGGIKRMLDGMAASKLNTFHWHLTDSQSFPFVSPRVPEMSEAGVFNSKHVYTPDDMREVTEYARIRGIRVIVEIDTPAHAGMGWTWGPSKGLGDLAVCVGQQPWIVYCGEPPCGQLNPHNPNVFKVLKDLFADISEFTGNPEIFHLGGDEVNLECWSQHHDNDGNYFDYHELWGNYTLKLFESLKQARNNKTLPLVILWSSNLTKRPYLNKFLDPEKVIIQVWNPQSWTEENFLIEDDYQLILSHVDAWYLDCGFGRWREHGDAACDPYRTWQKVYGHQPWTDLKLTKDKWHLILGGEVCLWTEQVDESSLDTRLWPRSAAFAERMWSDISIEKEYSNPAIPEDVYTRLDTHRDRLISRGINAEAIWPKWCSHNPGMCL